ncbi:MAG: DUF4350 domain-containing protein [Caldilineaceae bacterium]
MTTFLQQRNWTTLAVIILIGILSATALITNQGDAGRAFDPASNGPEGLLILRTWLEEMGYEVRTDDQASFTLPQTSALTPHSSLVLVYPGVHDFSQAEADQLYEWIAAGNSAVLFLATPADRQLQQRFGIDTAGSDYQRDEPVQPLLADHPDITSTVNGYENLLDLGKTSSAVSILATDEGNSALAVQHIGKGTLWFASERYRFTNYELGEEKRGVYFLPFLRTIRDGGIIQLDTYHLFGSFLGNDREIRSIQGWLYYTVWGNAVLFAGIVLALYLWLQGRRLGPPLPSQEELRRREAAEFVVAMANLYRRGDVNKDVAAYQKQRLKQALGRPLHLSANLDDDEFIKTLSAHDLRMNPARTQQITHLLNHLDHADENALIRSAAEIDQVLKEVGQ